MTRHQTLLVSVLTAFAVLAGPRTVFGQTEAPTLASLRTPPSPAFTVLGIEPSAVERPTTPSDVALSFVSKVRQGTVPKDYAFEVEPVLAGQPAELSWSSDVTRSVAESVTRTLSLSIATAETGMTASPLTSLAVGVRTLVTRAT